jgi:hypothetical protein
MELIEFLKSQYLNIQPYGRAVKFMKQWFMKNDFLSYYEKIIKKTEFLGEKENNFSERIYCILHDIVEAQKCKHCNEKARYNNFDRGYSNTCDKQECLKRHWNITEANGKTKAQNTLEKALRTMRADIDENGYDVCKRNAIRTGLIKRTKILKNGLTVAKNAGLKSREHFINDIDEFGRNTYQRNSRKCCNRLRNTVLLDGTNLLQLRTKRINENKSKDIVDGLNMHRRAAIKAARTMRTTILGNGLNIHQNAYLKRRDKTTCWKIRTKHYNEKLFYQSNDEKNFLDKAAEFSLLDQLDNGHTIKYFNAKNEVKNYYPDFSFKDIIFEIKSPWTYDQNGNNLEMRINNNLKLKGVLDSDYKVFLIVNNKAREITTEDFSNISTNLLASQNFVPFSKEIFQTTGD